MLLAGVPDLNLVCVAGLCQVRGGPHQALGHQVQQAMTEENELKKLQKGAIIELHLGSSEAPSAAKKVANIPSKSLAMLLNMLLWFFS